MAVFRLNYPYLGIFALNCPDFTIICALSCPDFTICAIFTLYMHSSMETAIGPVFMDILHFEDLRDTSVISECSLGVNLVIDNFFYVPADFSPLYKI